MDKTFWILSSAHKFQHHNELTLDQYKHEQFTRKTCKTLKLDRPEAFTKFCMLYEFDS